MPHTLNHNYTISKLANAYLVGPRQWYWEIDEVALGKCLPVGRTSQSSALQIRLCAEWSCVQPPVKDRVNIMLCHMPLEVSSQHY